MYAIRLSVAPRTSNDSFNPKQANIIQQCCVLGRLDALSFWRVIPIEDNNGCLWTVIRVQPLPSPWVSRTCPVIFLQLLSSVVFLVSQGILHALWGNKLYRIPTFLLISEFASEWMAPMNWNLLKPLWWRFHNLKVWRHLFPKDCSW